MGVFVNKVLISILGQDKPGIIAQVARAITVRHGNIENINQTLLHDIFGALVIATLQEDDNPDALADALRTACGDQYLFFHVDHYTPPPGPHPKPQLQHYVVTANGPDRQGLVAEIATALSRHQGNIINLYARLTGFSKRFDNVMIFEVEVPRGASIDALRDDLALVATLLGIEINIEHRRIFDAVSRIDL
jgi:glycine cleavage system transcriptional repressor